MLKYMGIASVHFNPILVGCLSDMGLDSGNDYIVFSQIIRYPPNKSGLICETSSFGEFSSLNRV